MALYNSRITRSIAPYADPKMLVVCKDKAGLANAAQDFIFDFTNPATWQGGAFPTVGAAVPATARFNNLARDAQPTITVPPETSGRTLAVQLGSYSSGWVMPTYDGSGAKFVRNTTQCLIGYKGSDQGSVGAPKVEGFVDFVETAWVKPASLAQGSIFARDTNYGIQFRSDGTIVQLENGATTPSPYVVGQQLFVGRLVRFNVSAGTSTIRVILGIAGSLTMSAAVAGVATSSYPGSGGVYAVGAQGGNSATTFDGTMLRMSREYVGLSGLSDAEILARLQAEYAWGVTAFAGL